MLSRKAGTIIGISAKGNARCTDLEVDMLATYVYEVTGMGPIQNVEEATKSVAFTVVAGDTTAQIMTKAKAAVDAVIAAG